MQCPECEKLWRVYAYATRQHLEVIKAHEEAAVGDDIHKMQVIEEALRGAEEWRHLSRKAVREHEATHDTEKKAATQN
jgi:hypothetical protein